MKNLSKTLNILSLSLLALIALPALGQNNSQQTPPSPDLSHLLKPNIQKYIEALGGQENLDQIETVRAKGVITTIEGSHIPYTIEFMPQLNRMRMDYVFQGIPATNAYDGETGWTIPPLLSRPEPKLLEGQELASIREQADFFGALINTDKKNYLLSVNSTGGIDQHLTAIQARRFTDAAKLPTEDLEIWYLNKITGLPERIEVSTEIEKRKRTITITHSDYQLVTADDVSFNWPFKIDSDYGRGDIQVNVIEQMEINLPLNERRFFADSVKQ